MSNYDLARGERRTVNGKWPTWRQLKLKTRLDVFHWLFLSRFSFVVVVVVAQLFRVFFRFFFSPELAVWLESEIVAVARVACIE